MMSYNPAFCSGDGHEIPLHVLSPFVHLCGEFSMAPGFGRAPWFTPEHHLIHVISGAGCYKVGDDTHHLVPEDVLLIQPGVWTQSWNPSDRPMRYHSVHFDFLFHGDYETLPVTSQEGGPELADRIHVPPRTVPALRLPLKTNMAGQSEVSILFSRIVREVAEKKPGYELATKASLLELLVLMHRGPETEPSVEGHALETIQRVVRFLEQNYTRPLSLGEIAGAVHLSPVYFGRLFRNGTGLTPMEYLRGLRMEQAKRLLFESDQTVGEVAAAVGFDDPYHFSRVFRKHEGMSPTCYRSVARDPRTPVSMPAAWTGPYHSQAGGRFFSIPPAKGS